MTSTAPRAIFDEDDLRKITGGSPDRGKDGEVAPIWGGTVAHGATIAHELRDAVLSRGNVFAARTYLPVSCKPATLIAAAPARQFDEAVLASSQKGVRYFGHWMLDDQPRLLAARDLGTPVSVLSNPTRGQREYIDLLGLSCAVEEDAYVRRLVVLEDVGQNLYKRDRHLALRQTAAQRARALQPPGVMLLRGGSGQHRALANEPDVAELARRRGFLVLDPSTASAQELIDACSDVDIVMGVEGSHLANGLMWMSRTGTLLVLQPPQRFVTVLKDHCDNLGMRYAFLVCDAVSEEGFRIAPDAVERMLDRVSTRMP